LFYLFTQDFIDAETPYFAHAITHRTHARKYQVISNLQNRRISSDANFDATTHMFQSFRNGMQVTHAIVDDGDVFHFKILSSELTG